MMSKGNRIATEKKIQELNERIKQLEEKQKSDEKISAKEKILLVTAILNFFKILYDIVKEFLN
jgi:hypothetical protein